MKVKLTLSLKDETIRKIKYLAKKREVNVSKIVEEIIDLILAKKSTQNLINK